jgi:secreted PhoX family phosphatase
MHMEDGPTGPDQPGGTFRWRMAATGGTPWQGGIGFANPDNLAVHRSGNIWIGTDRAAVNGSADMFGNNACWIIPSAGAAVGEPLLFATGPMECELTGPCFDTSESTLFLLVQPPGKITPSTVAAMRWRRLTLILIRTAAVLSSSGSCRWVPIGPLVTWADPQTRRGGDPPPGWRSLAE